MKIILTEKQVELLKSLNENQNPISDFERGIKMVNDNLNKLYTKVNFISIAELLNNEVDVGALIKVCDNIESTNDGIYTKISNYFNSFDEASYTSEVEDVHYKLENLVSDNTRKVNIISTLLMDLESIVNEHYDDGSKYNTPNIFSDIDSINLS